MATADIQTTPLKLLHITDTHIRATPKATLMGINTAHYFRAVVTQAFTDQVFDAVLLTGDLAQDTCLASYQYLYDTLAAYNTPCICLPGNHDDYALMQQVFATDSLTCRKQTVWGNWQLLCLNSQVPEENFGRLAQEELVFLQTCLEDKPKHFTLIAVHHHCLATRSAWMDTMIIQNHQQLFAIINQHPQVKAIVHGHVHQGYIDHIGSVLVMATPSTCFQFKPLSPQFAVDEDGPSYRTLSLYDDGRIETTVVRLIEPLMGLQTHNHGY